jgi:uncharacterized protein YdcH (DUF465 family)
MAEKNEFFKDQLRSQEASDFLQRQKQEEIKASEGGKYTGNLEAAVEIQQEAERVEESRRAAIREKLRENVGIPSVSEDAARSLETEEPTVAEKFKKDNTVNKRIEKIEQGVDPGPSYEEEKRQARISTSYEEQEEPETE